mmetsp:Transcript_17647/g.54974  ORF Transcript_17647/g.54974 Transcript_17647/m.54974 type:complete len:214 (+) Transcript_17647:1667-2308(+)
MPSTVTQLSTGVVTSRMIQSVLPMTTSSFSAGGRYSMEMGSGSKPSCSRRRRRASADLRMARRRRRARRPRRARILAAACACASARVAGGCETNTPCSSPASRDSPGAASRRLRRRRLRSRETGEQRRMVAPTVSCAHSHVAGSDQRRSDPGSGRARGGVGQPESGQSFAARVCFMSPGAAFSERTVLSTPFTCGLSGCWLSSKRRSSEDSFL